MTSNTRDYLADLALKKGVSLEGFQDSSQGAASDKIDELKTLPDMETREASPSEYQRIEREIKAIEKEIEKWTLTA